MRRIVYSFLMVSCCAGAVFAEQSPATLEVISGPVYVDQGTGLIAADQFTLLEVGDRILIKAGNTALLMNSTLGCTISLRDAGLYRVPDMANCLAGQASVLKSGVTITPANGVFEPVNVVLAGQTGGAVAGQGSVMMGLGFFGIVGITALTNTILENSNESPVSTP